MDSVLAHYIVLGARVREVIHLDIVLDALSDEAEAVLPYHHRVDCSLADKKLALQIFSLVYEAGLGIAFRVYIGMVHVPLTIHYLIPFPVDYRASGYGYLEDIRVIGYE